MRRLVNMSSVLTLEMMEEAIDLVSLNSVCLLIDAFNALVYAVASEEQTETSVYTVSQIKLKQS